MTGVLCTVYGAQVYFILILEIMFLYTNFLNQEMNHTNIRQKINFQIFESELQILESRCYFLINMLLEIFFFVIPLK